MRHLLHTALAALVGGSIGLAVAAMPTAPDWTHGYPPCVVEDAAGPCHWDARIQGNGQGHSFVVHAGGAVERRYP